MSVAPLDTATPARFRIQADFLGFSADTGAILEAAQAIVALGVRGCDDQTSVVIEAIHGESCSVVAEVQSVSDERAEAAVALVLDCLHDAANRPDCTSDVDISVQRTSGPAR